MNAETFPRVAEALAALIWPLLALVIAGVLLPVLREIVRQRQFTIKVGAFELSAQQATDQLARQIEDLQSKVAELETRTQTAPAPLSVGTPLVVLWVDDRPQNNALEIASLEAEGHRVVTARDSAEAVAALRRQPVDVILSDISRSLRGREGIDFLDDMRATGDMRPVGFYTSRASIERHGKALAGAFVATDSFVELMGAMRALSGKTGKRSDADELHP